DDGPARTRSIVGARVVAFSRDANDRDLGRVGAVAELIDDDERAHVPRRGRVIAGLGAGGAGGRARGRRRRRVVVRGVPGGAGGVVRGGVPGGAHRRRAAGGACRGLVGHALGASGAFVVRTRGHAQRRRDRPSSPSLRRNHVRTIVGA